MMAPPKKLPAVLDRLPGLPDIEEAMLLGCAQLLRQATDRRRVRVAHNGSVLSVRAYQRVASASNGSDAVYQPKLWIELTFDEVRQVVERGTRQIAGERDNIVAAQKILRLEARAPDARTVREACQRLHIDLSGYLAGEDVA